MAVIVAGCTNAQPSNTSTAQIIELREELRVVKEELAQLKKSQEQDDVNRIIKDFDKVAYLQAGDSGYSSVRYDLGVLTVQLADVEPYANGSRVVLRFGNPLFTAVNGLKAKIDWGHTNENGAPDNDSARSKDVTLNETLRPGAWTNARIVLEGVPPAQLGFVRLRDITHTGISLNR
jgi:hypothetical protein